MRKASKQIMITLMCTVVLGAQTAQTQTQRTNTDETDRSQFDKTDLPFTNHLAQGPASKKRGFSLMSSSSTVSASGSAAMVTPMAGGPSLPVIGGGTLGRLTKWSGFTSTNSFIANSTIFEDKFGSVGIGTDTPTSKLTVAGMIETTMGGLKFPDGTVQMTAAVGGLSSVFHDQTLIGNGTGGSPLGVAVPLVLNAQTDSPVIQAINTGGGFGVFGRGGSNGIISSGTGVRGEGGNSINQIAGDGVRGVAGDSVDGSGGDGVAGSGGDSDTGLAGRGVLGSGGDTKTGLAGVGVRAKGGDNTSSGSGGAGISAQGGGGIGSGNSGGVGIQATGGTGTGGASSGLAGKFIGDVQVTGNLSKGGGSFKIDHPLDPENKYLYHSFVESPDMKNIYDGNVVTDENGDAEVIMPEYFEALNSDFRYQLTVMGTFAQAIVSEKIRGNRFRIKTNAPSVEVSWQVTGVRQDAFARKNRIRVEVPKEGGERGLYLHPDAYGQPEEKSLDWAARNLQTAKRKDQ